MKKVKYTQDDSPNDNEVRLGNIIMFRTIHGEEMIGKVIDGAQRDGDQIKLIDTIVLEDVRTFAPTPDGSGLQLQYSMYTNRTDLVVLNTNSVMFFIPTAHIHATTLDRYKAEVSGMLLPTKQDIVLG